MSRSRGWYRLIAEPAAFVACAVLLATSMYTVRYAAADDRKAKEPEKRPSLDDSLLQDLDNELLEGAGAVKKPGDPRRDGGAPAAIDKHDKKDNAKQDKPAGGQDGGEIDDTAMQADEADPLVHVSREMRTVGELIPRTAKRTHAEQVQQRIVEDLTKLIEQAESQRAQQQSSASKSKKQPSTAARKSVTQPKQQAAGSSGKDSNKPAQDSTDRLGKAGAARPDPEMLKGFMKDAWGHLPAHDREQVLQTTREQFLPQYELMIEKYYKRLAEDERAR